VYLNVPITNYDEMHYIFSFSLATGKYAMGSKCFKRFNHNFLGVGNDGSNTEASDCHGNLSIIGVGP
jgi:hypothetical protein